MLCSICHKNMAVIFTKKQENGKQVTEGYCYNCAKEKGINPLELLAKQSNLSEDEIKDISSQFEDIFSEISNEIENSEYNGEEFTGGSIPLGSIFSNMFGAKSASGDSNNSSENGNKKVRTERRATQKKKSFLDVYGTNLTKKAGKGELDQVIGRENEIERIIQILNRRSKNNPCLIGEPGVRKNCNCKWSCN